MPPGWIQQWDQGSQRWYYVEQATGRTQWDPPAHLPPGPYAPPPSGAPYQAPGGHDERGLFGNTQGHQGHDYTPSGAATNEKEKKKDKSGHSTAMLAAAGIGGIAAGAWIGHELSTFPIPLTSLIWYANELQPKTTINPLPMQGTPLLQPHTAPLHPAQRIRMAATRMGAQRTRRPCRRTMRTARRSRVVIASRWRRSARS
jgi:hypothetical protein